MSSSGKAFLALFSWGEGAVAGSASPPLPLPSPLAHKYRRDNRYWRAIHTHTHTYTEVVARPGIHRTTATTLYLQSSTFTTHHRFRGRARCHRTGDTRIAEPRVRKKPGEGFAHFLCYYHGSLQVKNGPFLLTVFGACTLGETQGYCSRAAGGRRGTSLRHLATDGRTDLAWGFFLRRRRPRHATDLS